MFTFTQEDENKIEKIVEKYPVKLSALLPLLTLVQRREGYISPEAMQAIGKKLDVSPGYVQSVMSFYTMYHTEPTGKYIILFCHNISCQLNGADDLFAYTGQKLGVIGGGTTKDSKFTLIRKNVLPPVAVLR
jgi:NADH-quinone oxidoreductase subunit E